MQLIELFEGLEQGQVKQTNKVDMQGKKIFSLLETQCSQIMNLYRDNAITKSYFRFFYRGMKDNTSKPMKPVFVHGKPHENRRPLTSSASATKIINSVMAAANIKARRDNSVFMTSADAFARQFGTPYIMFPKDGFDFSWSPIDRDVVLGWNYLVALIDENAFDELRAIISDINRKIYELPVQTYTTKTFIDRHFENLSHYDLVDDLLRKNLLEITTELDVGERYKYLVSTACITPESYIKGTQVQTSGLDKALISGNEVLVNGEYYGIHKDFEEYIVDYMLKTKNGG